MISCVDFIPAYSILFEFLEEKVGYEGVNKYWEYISDNYVQPSLGIEVEKNGLKGCWNYWSHSLNEEAADFDMDFDPEKKIFSISMHHCPSKGRLLDMKHMKPYDKYCYHCDLLYRRVVERYGLKYDYDFSKIDHAICKLSVRENKK